MSIINSKVHGILDYLTVVFLALSPRFFEMEGGLATFTYALAVVHFLLTIFTRFEAGVIKLIPFKIHGVIELFVAVILAGVAFYFYYHSSTLGFYFYIWFAVVILVVFLLTNFRSGENSGN